MSPPWRCVNVTFAAGTSGALTPRRIAAVRDRPLRPRHRGRSHHNADRRRGAAGDPVRAVEDDLVVGAGGVARGAGHFAARHHTAAAAPEREIAESTRA